MTEILKKKRLSDQVYRYRLSAPRIDKKHKAGQFIILRPVIDSERIPLTISNSDGDAGWIEIIFQVVGRTTMILSTLNEGDNILDLAGPLGNPAAIEKFGKCVCIGGGVGVAPLYPIICALKSAGNDIVSIIGARSKNLVILENEIKKASHRIFVATDDGSKGRPGFVSDVFKQLIAAGEKFDAAFVIGPVMMMKVTTGLTIAAGIKSYASLNPIMIDGTGMCGGCRVTVFNKTKFACLDGPEFDADGIDWNELIKRLNSYRMFESEARKKYKCKLGNV
ncbi:MAG: sulfide/dihydroorotate dehydrogenase-like FAD/NAD-binding protein [Chitinispirillaceae bacterium]|nr:sulfide/dihydroorotate dehydrogenase-like FAD/NAD-binding protein [Chitinispirillaceae bacterium]